jgi:hypothetical protein
MSKAKTRAKSFFRQDVSPPKITLAGGPSERSQEKPLIPFHPDLNLAPPSRRPAIQPGPSSLRRLQFLIDNAERDLLTAGPRRKRRLRNQIANLRHQLERGS